MRISDWSSDVCSSDLIERARAAYAGSDIQIELATFFSDIPQRLAQAHLVICRSGASTTAELTTAGRPSILVPYPHAMDDHQTMNAKAIEAANAAIVIAQSDFTPETLTARQIGRAHVRT